MYIDYVMKYILKNLGETYLRNDTHQIDDFLRAIISNYRQLDFLYPCIKPNLCPDKFERLFYVLISLKILLICEFTDNFSLFLKIPWIKVFMIPLMGNY